MRKHLEQYEAARAAHIAAKRRAEETRAAVFATPYADRLKDLEKTKAVHAAHTAACREEERASIIRKAAKYIAEQYIKAEAAPIIAAVLRKYQGKPAGPKTREKAAAEIAETLGAKRAYFSYGYYGGPINRVCITFDGFTNEIDPEIYAAGFEPMIDENNRFTVRDIPKPNLDNLPENLETWADDFERAADDLEAARKAFEEAASKARAVNLGDARLKEYRITNN